MNWNYLKIGVVIAGMALLHACKIDDQEAPIPAEIPAEPCNGSTSNCARAYNEMSFATTHKSYNYKVGTTQFQFPSQMYPLHQQLRDGARAFIIDVYENGGNLSVYNNQELFGSEGLSASLSDVETFMDENPREVITLIFDTDVSATSLAGALVNANLDAHAYVPNPAQTGWPTLGEMIETDNRLVIFTTNSDMAGAPEWVQFAWDHIDATDADITSRSNFSCTTDQGTGSNSLYLMHHHVNTSAFGINTGVANEDSSEVLNRWENLFARTVECRNSRGAQVNFISVDFFWYGDTKAVVDSLNVLGAP